MFTTMTNNNQKSTDYHPGGMKNLSSIIDNFSLTMQHALRINVYGDLQKRALEEAGVLPPLSPLEMFDYCMDTDSEFLNWLFPYCAVRLTPENMSYTHQFIVRSVRTEIETMWIAEQRDNEKQDSLTAEIAN